MDEVPENEMSSDEKAEYYDFQQRWEKMEEEVKENRCLLREELKSIQSFCSSVVSQFHDKMKNLAKLRQQTENMIAGCQLYALSLSSSINEHQRTERKLIAMANLIPVYNDKIRVLELEQEELSVIKTKLESKMRKEREVDQEMKKNFRSNLENESDNSLDQNVVDMLRSLFYKRERRKVAAPPLVESRTSIVDRRSILSRYQGREDPTWRIRRQDSIAPTRSTGTETGSAIGSAFGCHLTEALKGAHDEAKSGVDNGFIPLSWQDVPEQFEKPAERLWNCLVKLRDMKIGQEMKLDSIGTRICEIQKRSEDIAETVAKLNCRKRETESLLRREFDALQESRQTAAILIRVKQIQDEIGMFLGATCQESEEALFIPMHCVEYVNQRLREAHREGRDLHIKTQEFDQKIKEIQWEKEYLDLCLEHSKETIIDYQYLRIDSTLQFLLSGEKEDSHDVKASKERVLHERRVKVYETQIARHREGNARLVIDLTKLEKENALLEENVAASRERNRAYRSGIRIDRQQNVLMKGRKVSDENRMKSLQNEKRIKELLKLQEQELQEAVSELNRWYGRSYFVPSASDKG